MTGAVARAAQACLSGSAAGEALARPAAGEDLGVWARAQQTLAGPQRKPEQKHLLYIDVRKGKESVCEFS
jgi:hypothetical protein